MLRNALLAGAALLVSTALPISPAAALTMKECGAKYQDAKKANTLKGQSWNAFRKAQCADDDADETEAAAAVTEPATPAATTAKPAATTRAKAAVFPKAVSPKYSDQSAGRARLRTCADQYNANKAANANGDLKWIAKGGGYWSQCNTKLKG